MIKNSHFSANNLQVQIRSRGMCGQSRDKTHVRNFSRQTDRDHLGDLGVDGRTILKKSSWWNRPWWRWLKAYGSGPVGPVVEYRDQPLGQQPASSQVANLLTGWHSTLTPKHYLNFWCAWIISDKRDPQSCEELGLNHRVRASYKWTPHDTGGPVARCDTSAFPEGRLLDVRVGKGRHYTYM